MGNYQELAFEAAPIGLIVAEHRVIRQLNARFAEMFDYSEAELIGQSLSLLYPSAEEFERIGSIGTDAMARTGRYSDERIMQRKGGGLFWCRVRGQSVTPEDPFARSVWSFADLSDTRPVTSLSKREREVATQLAEGRTSKEIARDLNISPRTVEVHRARLLSKFDARNTAELIARLSGVPL